MCYCNEIFIHHKKESFYDEMLVVLNYNIYLDIIVYVFINTY